MAKSATSSAATRRASSMALRRKVPSPLPACLGSTVVRHRGVAASAAEETTSNVQEVEPPMDPRPLGEQEAEFLQAMRDFYFTGKPSMTNEKFDALKESLTWAGSELITMSSTELKFLEAKQAAMEGNPVMSTDDFERLKMELLDQGSIVCADGPRCDLSTKQTLTDATTDLRTLALLNVPGVLIGVAVLIVANFATGGEVIQGLELPEPLSLEFLWLIIVPVLYIISSLVTGLLLKDALVLKAACPNCGTESRAFFGELLTVSSADETIIQCENCGEKSKFIRKTRKRELIPPKK